MKSSTLFAVLAAAAVSLTANAKCSQTLDATGFEGLTAGEVVTSGIDDTGASATGSSHFYLKKLDGAENSTKALKYADGGAVAPTADELKPGFDGDAVGKELPQEFRSGTNAQYLKLNTEGSTLWRTINVGTYDEQEEYAFNPYTLESDLYLDTVMQFTKSEEAPEAVAGEKIALWLGSDGYLYVKSARAAVDDFYEWDIDASNPTVFKTNMPLDANKWYRVTIRAIKDITEYESGLVPAFVVYINGNVVEADVADDNAVVVGDLKPDLSAFVYSPIEGQSASKKLFPSLAGCDPEPTIDGLGFQGTGVIDDFVATTCDPAIDDAEYLDYSVTLALDENVSSVTYQIGEGEETTITEGATVKLSLVSTAETATLTITGITYKDGYMAAGIATAGSGIAAGETAGAYTLTLADLDGAGLSISSQLAGAKIGDTMYATAAEALSAAADGETVTFIQDVAESLGAVSTKAGTIDFNGKTVKLGNVTFTGDCDATLTGGDFDNSSAAIDVIVPAGKSLTFSGMTFHGTLQPKVAEGLGGVFTCTGCTFKNDKDTNGKTDEQDGTKNVSYASYNLTLGAKGTATDKVFSRYDVVGNTFNCMRRSSISTAGGASALVVYVYDNDFCGTKNCHTAGEYAYRFPTMQVNDGSELYYENNRLCGDETHDLIQGAFALYKSYTKVVCRGNQFDETVDYVWCLYEKSASPTVYFGDNTFANADINKTNGFYKFDQGANGVAYDVDANCLTLPEGCGSFYDWAHGENASSAYFVGGAYYGDLSTVAKDDAVVTMPFAAISGLGASFGLDNVADKVNAYTAIDKPTAVTFKVAFGANVTSATYKIGEGEATSIANGGTIADVAPGSVVTFAFETTNDGYVKTATATGNVTANGLAFTVASADDLINPAVKVNFFATLAFAKVYAFDGTLTTLCTVPTDAWPYAKDGSHYVQLLQTNKRSSTQLELADGERAYIDLNGFEAAYWSKSQNGVLANVKTNDSFATFTGYANLAAAWTDNGSKAQYCLGSTSKPEIDVSVITLTKDNLTFEGYVIHNTENASIATIKTGTEPALAEGLEKTDDWAYTVNADTSDTFKYVAKSTSTGPAPADGNKSDVEPVEGKDNTYVVTPTEGNTTGEVVVQGVNSGDTLVVSNDVTTISVDNASGVTIKVTTPNATTPAEPYDITAACKGWTGNTFDTALDPEATVQVTTSEGKVDVPVEPTLIEETTTEKPLVVGDNVETKVQAIPGLTYKLVRDDALGGSFSTVAASGKAESGTATITLKDTAKPAGKAFYKVLVTK